MQVDFAFQRQNIRFVGQTHKLRIRKQFSSRRVKNSPAERLLHFVHIRQIIKEKVWCVLRQPFARPRASRYRDCPGTERFPAGDVVPGVADDVDVFGLKIEAGVSDRASEGARPERVPVVVIVRESAKGEKMPEIVMSQLQSSAAFQVPG